MRYKSSNTRRARCESAIMSDNVQDGFGPVLQRIQERLSAIEGTQRLHTAKLDDIADDMRVMKRMSKAALGTASGAELQADDAERSALRANRRIDDLVAALKQREIDVDA